MSNLRRTDIPAQLRAARLMVIGDVMLDQTVFGVVSRISPEAPIPVMAQQRIQNQCGGAANTAMTLSALQIPTVLIGVVGTDDAAESLHHTIDTDPNAALLNACLIADSSRPTTFKQRFRAQGQQIFRRDHESRHAIDATSTAEVLQQFRQHLAQVDAVIISDYGKGALSSDVLLPVIAEANAANVPVIIDPVPQSIVHYRGADFITPNRSELQGMVGEFSSADPEISATLHRACADFGIGGVLLTRSEEGMSLYRCSEERHHYRPATAREVFDVTGAGDTLCALFAAGLAAKFAPEDALEIAAAAAAIVVAKVGSASVTMRELLQQLQPVSNQSTEVHSLESLHVTVLDWQKKGEKVGFTNGCFDLLHPGHMSLLQFCAAECDRLIVAVNSDASVRRLKGATRPINSAENRCSMLQALPQVAAVIVFEEDTPLTVLETLRPDCLFKGGDYSAGEIVGAELLASYGGTVRIAPLKSGYATTNTIAKIHESQ